MTVLFHISSKLLKLQSLVRTFFYTPASGSFGPGSNAAPQLRPQLNRRTYPPTTYSMASRLHIPAVCHLSSLSQHPPSPPLGASRCAS
jgi:hypothetical protein